MYDQRFGLHRKPFQSVIGEHDFFASQSFRELEPDLLHALQTDLGVAVLTGPSGVGKSVALEQIQRTLDAKSQTVLLRGGAVRGSTELLYLLHRRLIRLQPEAKTNSESSATRIIQRCEVVERLERVASFWGPLSILLDDAHLVSADVFSELRSLLEEGNDGRRCARLLITGPLLLEEVLAESGNSHFARKIRTHGFLQPLRSDESVQYLRHQFQSCGGDLNAAFETKALELIVSAADGLPQCLNLLADECLMICEETDCDVVDDAVVRTALNKLRHLPYSWNVTLIDHSTRPANPDCNSEASSSSSIEIGDFPSDDAPSGFSNHSGASGTEVIADGVIEIGATHQQSREEVIEASLSSLDEETENTNGFAEASAELDDSVELTEIEVLSADSMVSDSTVEFKEASDQVDPSEGVEISLEEFEAIQPTSEVEDELFGSEIDEQAALCEFESDDLANEHLFADLSPQHTDPTEADCGQEENGFEEHADHDSDSVNSDALYDADETVAPVSEVISDYQPWSPAGQWPAAQASSETEQTHASSAAAEIESWNGLSTNVEGSTADADQTTEPALEDSTECDSSEQDHLDQASEWTPLTTAASSTLQAGTLVDGWESVLDSEARPVVDRFTWAELGRLESIDETTSFTDANTDHAVAQTESLTGPSWPPTVKGLAPGSQIPISDLDDDYSELLNDLGLLIEATSQRTDSTSELDEPARQPSFEEIQTALAEATRESSADPEGTINELQQLLEEEQQRDDRSENVAHAEASSESEDSEPAEDKQNLTEETTAYPDAAPRFFSMKPADPVDLDSKNDSTAADDASPSMNEQTFAAAGNDPDPDVVSFQQIAEEREEWMEQQVLASELATEEASEDEQALPSLLRKAKQSQRQRVLSIGLKQAAGAETVDVPQNESSPELNDTDEPSHDATISLMIPEAAAAEDEDPKGTGSFELDKEPKPAAGFSNLFTRLRSRRRKAS